MFEQLVKYCDKYLTMIPLSFILGFYVTMLVFPLFILHISMHSYWIFNLISIICFLPQHRNEMVVSMYGPTVAR